MWLRSEQERCSSEQRAAPNPQCAAPFASHNPTLQITMKYATSISCSMPVNRSSRRYATFLQSAVANVWRVEFLGRSVRACVRAWARATFATLCDRPRRRCACACRTGEASRTLWDLTNSDKFSELCTKLKSSEKIRTPRLMVVQMTCAALGQDTHLSTPRYPRPIASHEVQLCAYRGSVGYRQERGISWLRKAIPEHCQSVPWEQFSNVP